MPLVTPGVFDAWVTAYVVFEPSRHAYWWRWFTGPTGHCWVLWTRWWPEPGLLAEEWTLKAEHTPGGLYVDLLPVPPASIAEELARTAADVLRLHTRVRRATLRYFGLQNCVTVVKSVLNMDAPWCHTPAQLHRRLRAMGARSLVRNEP